MRCPAGQATPAQPFQRFNRVPSPLLGIYTRGSHHGVNCGLLTSRGPERDPEGTRAPQSGAPHITGGTAGQGIRRSSTQPEGELESAAITGG
ncbi:hypothetical protein NDU88_006009 [Pleurodeles waltl]|uniref:Uncharacterized protein n=1 Tax=Pleurodeles waltl TaxID=8319 RepID=A0AAV7PHA2_PLEWA|nr:hypothetical protein NDU88_006009 [Pleurodeles waltl]